MRVITTATFIFNSKLDKYYLKNLTAAALPYKLSLLAEGKETVIKDNTTGVPANSTEEIIILADGKYQLLVGGAVFVYFQVWTQLRTYILPLVEEALRPCCECSSPKDIDYLSSDTKMAIEAQSLYNLLEYYKTSLVDYSSTAYLTKNTKLSDFWFEAANTNKYITTPLLQDQMMKAAMDGKTVNNVTLYRCYIAITYLGLYSYDKDDIDPITVNNASELQTLNTIYNFNIISSYIHKLGIDISATLNLFS